MNRLSFAGPRVDSAGRASLFERAMAALGLALVGSGVGLLIGGDSPLLRAALAAIIALSLFALFELDPRIGIIATMLYLPMIAVTRRLLISKLGWEANDPLLLVAPIVLLAMSLRMFVQENRRLGGDPLSAVVTLITAIAILQSLNPRNGSAAVGAAGLLFTAIPLLWFYLGREFLDQLTTRRLLTCVAAIATVVGAYGLVQLRSGLPSWDAAWAQQAGYSALFGDDGSANMFGTFSSASEFTLYIAIGLITVIAFAVNRRPLALFALPLLLPALFLSSYRGGFVLALVALVVMLAARFTSRSWTPAVIGVLTIAVVFAAPAASAVLTKAAGSASDERVSYQLGGLGNPFDAKTSTVPMHFQRLRDGISRGISDPIGSGSGSTNIASKLNSNSAEQTSQTTEVDFSDAFVAFGLIGGLAFLTAIWLGLSRAWKNYSASRDAVSLAVLGILIVALGHWLSGGHYAVTPLIWLLLGWTAAVSRRPSEAAETADVAAHAPAALIPA